MYVMKKLISSIIAISILVTGCALWKPTTKQNNKEQDKMTKAIDAAYVAKEKIHQADVKKLENSAVFTYGVGYSLNQVTNVTPPIATAIKLNSRIASIVGSPTLDEMNKMTMIVDLLNSELAEEQAKGAQLLKEKDSQIVQLQTYIEKLKIDHEAKLENVMIKSQDAARKSDNATATVNEMSGMFGLNAVWWGLKRFVLSFTTFILIGAVLFLILRVAANSNPIAASIFSVFNIIGSGVIHLVKGLAPKAAEVSKLVHLDEYNKYRNTLNKIVDTIETFKIKCEAGGKQCTLGELLDELDREMDKSDKDCIKHILKDQKWN